MRRIRRVSIEVIRREFNVSVTRQVVAALEARLENRAQDGREMQESLPPPAECPVCASPWFALSADSGEQAALVQRALRKHGIHTQLSLTGELFVCGRSFELHVGALAGNGTADQEKSAPWLGLEQPQSVFLLRNLKR